MSESVVDSSVVLGVLFAENVGDEAKHAIAAGAAISAVNVAEVLAKLQERGASEEQALTLLNKLPLDVVAFTARHAALTARLRAPTKSLGLSLGDRACLALGLDRSVPIFTLDQAWTKLADFEIRLARA